jgi:hypothetical protein
VIKLAVTAFWYGLSLKGQWGTTAGNRINWTGDAIKVALATSTYTPDQDVHDFFNDITNEVVGTGYTAGGVSLTTKTLTYDTATNETRLDAEDAAGTTATFTARYAVVYDSTPGTAATNPLMGYVNFGGDQTVSTGNFTIQWDATGVLKVTAA